MTTQQTEQLIGARVTDGDGKIVGTVQRVFNDDADGRPVWAQVRAGKLDRFVPLGGSRVTGDGLGVPFDAQKIMSAPDISADRHMSAAQTDVLKRYYGLAVPAQGGPPNAETRSGEMQAGETRRGETQRGETQAGVEWLIRTEERVDVGTEMLESGRARLHKYVDVEPIEQAIHVYHEEYDVERIPITADEQITGSIQEGEQEIILHEERAVVRKEIVPVERVRLRAKRVEEDSTVRDDLRRERIEIEPDQSFGTGRS